MSFVVFAAPYSWSSQYRSTSSQHLSREQLLNELKETKKWATLHVADNCCFHYRKLMLKILEEST